MIKHIANGNDKRYISQKKEFFPQCFSITGPEENTIACIADIKDQYTQGKKEKSPIEGLSSRK